MKTEEEIETAVSEGISRFEQDYMGRGPKDIQVHLLDDLLLIRLRGVLAAVEKHLVKSLPDENGRVFLKQVRSHLVETTRPASGIARVMPIALATGSTHGKWPESHSPVPWRFASQWHPKRANRLSHVPC